jgi:hypothetical protein
MNSLQEQNTFISSVTLYKVIAQPMNLNKL